MTNVPGTIYLIHFRPKLAQAQHYIGWSGDIDAREVRHRKGDGARLLRAVAAAGIPFRVVRTWAGTRPGASAESLEESMAALPHLSETFPARSALFR